MWRGRICIFEECEGVLRAGKFRPGSWQAVEAEGCMMCSRDSVHPRSNRLRWLLGRLSQNESNYCRAALTHARRMPNAGAETSKIWLRTTQQLRTQSACQLCHVSRLELIVFAPASLALPDLEGAGAPAWLAPDSAGTGRRLSEESVVHRESSLGPKSRTSTRSY